MDCLSFAKLNKYFDSIGVQEIVAMTRCSAITHDVLDYDEYVRSKSDPTIKFHTQGGADIIQVVPNFRTADLLNRGHAVLISYQLDKRITIETSSDPKSALITDTQLLDLIESILGYRISNTVGWHQRPFMHFGLDSLQIMELRTKLQLESGKQLSSTALFDFPTPEQLLASLTSSAENSSTRQRLDVKISSPSAPQYYAICGMSCRFPRAGHCPDTFYRNLFEGMNSVQPLPKEWGWDCRSSHAGLLDDDDAELFNPAAYGLSVDEATVMDPHQRILLQVSVEALADSRLLAADNKRLRRRIGVFVGLCNNEWVRNTCSMQTLSPFLGSATAQSSAANRLSFLLGLNGPSLVIDSACSSSLTALHTAVNSLRCGDCDAAVVAAADLLLSPYSLQVHF